jgi:hypothetical protein
VPVATIEVQRDLAVGPEAVWRQLLAVEAWPAWSPLFQFAAFATPEQGLHSEWTLHGLLGRIPYNGTFTLIEHRPLARLAFESQTISTPYDWIIHDIRLTSDEAGSPLRWRIDYAMAGGPGGLLIDRLLIRRQLRDQLERQLQCFTPR